MNTIIQGINLHGSVVIIVQCVCLASFATLVASSSLRIIGGRDVNKNELPYVVRLEYEISFTRNNFTRIRHWFFCTGSTLTPRWTLTAGHCLLNKNGIPYPYKKVVGYGTPTGKSKGSKRSYILKEISRYKTRSRKYEDIALLKTEPILIKKYGKLSALDYASLLYQEVRIAGYGDTNYTNPVNSKVELESAYNLKKPLQVMQGMLISCPEYRETFNFIGYLCMNAKCSVPATVCSGDSGGPIIHSTGIVGVESGGPTENNCQMISDFFRIPFIGYIFLVSPYINWVYKVVNSDNTKLLSRA